MALKSWSDWLIRTLPNGRRIIRAGVMSAGVPCSESTVRSMQHGAILCWDAGPTYSGPLPPNDPIAPGDYVGLADHMRQMDQFYDAHPEYRAYLEACRKHRERFSPEISVC